MNKQMIISVMSKDRPGIVADVTGAIFELDGDLADLKQSVLNGYFTMILIATFPERYTPEDVHKRLTLIQSEIKLEVIVKTADTYIDSATASLPEKTYVVTAQGENKSGLVYGISSFCYRHDVNIIDLATTLVRNQYTMILQLDLSLVDNVSLLGEELERFASKSGLTVVMQHYDIFKATNEVTLF